MLILQASEEMLEVDFCISVEGLFVDLALSRSYSHRLRTFPVSFKKGYIANNWYMFKETFKSFM